MRKFTQKLNLKQLIVAAFVLMYTGFSAQNVSVAGALVGNGSYATLAAALTAINGGAQTAANITVSIVNNTAEGTTAPTLNAGLWNSFIMVPSGGASRVVAGAPTSGLLILSDADKVYIDGLNTGGNALTFSNTSTGTSASTIRFLNGATNNTVTNCSVLGINNSVSAAGNIHFSTSTATVGNSFNTISNCTVSAITAGGPGICILSNGSSGVPNTDNIIQNCNISDYFKPALASNYGILISGNSSKWTITGNKFFQTVARVYTNATHLNKMIDIGTGSDYNISNNVFGYSANNATGQYNISGLANRITCIELSATAGALPASVVQGNTITAFTQTTTSTTGLSTGAFCGISVLTGNAVVSGNLIGATSGTTAINVNPGSGGTAVGIQSGSTGTISIANNYVGSINVKNVTAANVASFHGIVVSGIATQLSVSNNTIGNPTAENITAGTYTLNTGNSLMSGINLSAILGGITATISGNLIQNLSCYGTGTGGYIRGIWNPASAHTATYIVTSNTITNLVGSNSNATIANGLVGTAGIIMANCAAARISDNLISNVANTGSATTAINTSGISFAHLATNVTIITSTISGNRIYNINNSGTGTTTTAPPIAAGITIRSASSVGILVYNNMISLGAGTSGASCIGIYGNHGQGPFPAAAKIYHNTINITGTATGALPSFGYHRGDFSATARTSTVNIKNNLITNSRSGGSGVHLAIGNNYGIGPPSAGWLTGTSDNNVLNTSNPSAVGWWGNAGSLSAWKAVTGGDQNSYSGIPVTYVNSASDLHLNMGLSLTAIESGGQSGLNINTDIDSQVRPGPAASVNGGAVAPDIGADEFDGKEGGGPVISYVPITNICSAGDRTLSATIIEPSGVPTTGILMPRIYFKKNTGLYFSSPGSLTSGSSTNGTWSFTISAATMAGLSLGDAVSYYIVAQDQASSNNIGANPGIGLVAVDVNVITTPPTTPNIFYVSNTLAGTYTVGSTGTYTSLTAAANAYNNSCITAPVTFVLTDALYSAAESFPIVFMNNLTASAINSLLVIPATGNPAVITPTTTSDAAVIKFLNARYITFDGLTTSGSSMAINNANVNSASANMWLASSPFVGPGCNSIEIKNIAFTGGTVSASSGIVSSVDFANPIAAGGIDNDNVTIQGNTFLNFNNCIAAFGTGSVSAGGLDNWNILGNTIGPVATSTNVVIAGSGIILSGAVNCSVTSNIVQNITTSVASVYGISMNDNVVGFAVSQNTLVNFYSYGNTGGITTIAGIYTGPGSINGVVSTNSIVNITSPSVDGYGARGITINSGNSLSNINVRNNFVAGINSVSDDDGVLASYWPVGIALEGAATGGVNVDFNSVNLYGVHPGYEGAVANAASADLVIASGGGNINIRNNILCNTYGSTFTTVTLQDMCYAIYCYPVSAGGFPVMNNNSYYVGGVGSPTHTAILGYLGTATLATLYDLQLAFGQNLNSINVQPQFTTTDDLHLVTNSVVNAALNNYAQPLASITNDFDNQIRNVITPDIGADEFNATATCTSAIGGSISPTTYTLCSPQNLLLNSPNISSGLGTTYTWKISTAAGGPYTAVATGTGITAPTFYGPLNPGTYYMVLQSNCASPILAGVSNEATVTIFPGPNNAITSTSTFVCQGTSINIIGSPGAASYIWSTGATTESITVVPTANTVYAYTATTAPCIVTASINIGYSANPVITAVSASTYICLANQATLTASGANTYTWTDGTSSINGATVNPSPTVATTYSIVGTNTSGCTSAQITQSISVNFPTVTVSGNSAICPGQSTTLTASGAVSYSWDTSAPTNTISVTPATSTVYVVTGTDAQGCKSSTSQSVSVGNISVTIAGSSTVCTGSALSLTVNGAATYTWSDGSQTQTIVPTPTISSTYSVLGVSGTCSSTAAINVTVNPLPTTTITTITSPSICPGETITLTGGGATTYTWNTNVTTTAIAVSPTINTTYTVTGKNLFGCTAPTTIAVTANPGATVNVVASATAVCLSSAVTYTASGANTYTWNTTGPVSTVFSATPTANATYTVVGTNTAGCTGSKTVSIVSNTLPIIAITPATSATVCIGKAPTFTASGASTYTWDGITSGAAISYTPLINATHTVVATNAAGCVSSSTVAVSVNPLPTITINPATTTICAQSPASFTASGANSYTWNAITTNSTATFFPNTNTTYTVVGMNTFGCSSSASVLVNVNPLPSVNISPAFTTVCAFSTFSLSASGASTYVWFNTNTTTVVAITPSNSTSYSVVGTNTNGCSSSALAVVITNSLPIISVTPANATICPSTSQNLVASGADTYTWNGSIGTTSNVVVNPSVTTTYTVFGTETINGCVSSETVTVNTYTSPVITITPSSASICLNSTGTLTAAGATTFTWSGIGSSASVSVSPTSNTTYSVSGTNSDGCVSSNTIVLAVNPLPTIAVSPGLNTTICNGETITYTASGASSYTWSPGNVASANFSAMPTSATIYTVEATDAVGCKNKSLVTLLVNACTGVKENTSVAFVNVYPNPSEGRFNIDLSNNDAIIVIYDLLGAILYDQKLQAGNHIIALDQTAKGVYLMKVIVGAKHQTVRLIVQ